MPNYYRLMHESDFRLTEQSGRSAANESIHVVVDQSYSASYEAEENISDLNRLIAMFNLDSL